MMATRSLSLSLGFVDFCFFGKIVVSKSSDRFGQSTREVSNSARLCLVVKSLTSRFKLFSPCSRQSRSPADSKGHVSY